MMSTVMRWILHALAIGVLMFFVFPRVPSVLAALTERLEWFDGFVPGVSGFVLFVAGALLKEWLETEDSAPDTADDDPARTKGPHEGDPEAS
jgi:hypothetical protein